MGRGGQGYVFGALTWPENEIFSIPTTPSTNVQRMMQMLASSERHHCKVHHRKCIRRELLEWWQCNNDTPNKAIKDQIDSQKAIKVINQLPTKCSLVVGKQHRKNNVILSQCWKLHLGLPTCLLMTCFDRYVKEISSHSLFSCSVIVWSIFTHVWNISALLEEFYCLFEDMSTQR